LQSIGASGVSVDFIFVPLRCGSSALQPPFIDKIVAQFQNKNVEMPRQFKMFAEFCRREPIDITQL
jgi:hypothetical protein